MVFAVEEPEAFLHPSAQENLRDHLEQMGAASSVSLLVTTHSPFLVTKSPNGKVFCLAKDVDGRTRISNFASGDADHAPLVGGLLREETIESLLAAASVFPGGSQAVVLVEGDGDKRCLEHAAHLVGRPDLLDGLVIRPCGGTIRMIAQAVITKASTDLPIVIVVDNDDPGRHARSTLSGNTFGFNKKQILTYALVFDDDKALADKWQTFPVEAEDLFDPGLLDAFVEANGESILEGKQKRPDGAWHYDMGESAKQLLDGWVTAEAMPHQVKRWVDMLLRIRTTAALEVPEEAAAELVDSVGDAARGRDDLGAGGRVLVVVGQHDHARYLSDSAIVLTGAVDSGIEFTRVGFYSRAILPHVPLVLADHPNLQLSGETSAQLRATGKDVDRRLAEFVDRLIWENKDLAGTTARVLLLSGPESADTVVLPDQIKNTKQLSSKPVAWTIGPRVIPLDALTSGVSTTDDLDRRIETMGARK